MIIIFELIKSEIMEEIIKLDNVYTASIRNEKKNKLEYANSFFD